MNIAIIVPAYNEKKNLINLVKEINKNVVATIIIVDDSPDQSSKILFKDKPKNIKFLYRGKKLGRGSAVIFGLKKALKIKKITYFIEMDADLSHKPSELKKNLDIFNKNKLDLLIASRYLEKSKIINWPKSRRVLSKLSNKMARYLLGIPISDYTNGYRIYSKRATNLITKKCGRIGDGFIVLSEIIMLIDLKKYKIGETHTKFINRIRGESSVNFKLILQSLQGIFKLYFIKKFKKV